MYDVKNLRFLSAQRTEGSRCLRKIKSNLPKADLCLLLKVLDIMGKNRKVSEEILKKVPCPKILVSFSTKKLSGKSMTRPRRIWFERTLEHLGFPFKKFEIPNEIFYLIDKN